ncbi:RagB/SusD family nutrient uptake outer membrane protein [Belliella kenyensis]|uniref:RagB/SusD family nutrient uptake outer membrane protein n=1 Tax=Belliella kenyensis TaxID=1472724 RepID=A0ABV8ER42_9BACT|nr:RagB/SusD family nutrient uptake outer membrane protein [Belliella kenyensis]MCH7402005.1 RagB/SusD family nutrient uptake outer membrane protein [Belliella kenyensis]MDN3605169.1 RagB/SusD family nutrient uptake outer membrane protein [Belliella kenyensis]
MKNSIKIFLGATLMILFSCSEDLLQRDPISSFSAQGFYQTSSDAQAGVYGIYDAVQATFSINFAYWGEGRADAVNTNQAGDPFLLQQNTLNSILASARWNNIYETISRANYAIKYVPTVFEGDSEFGIQLVAQARALRALSYFYAVRVWGDVPLILEPYESIQQDIFPTRTSKELVLNQIEADLLFASANCRANFGGQRDRILITKGGADAMLTHLYMWKKDYASAIQSAERVMNNNLYSLVTINDWSRIFTQGYTNESIFEIGYNEVQRNSLRILYALGSDSNFFPSVSFRNAFEEGDLRRDLIYDVTETQPRKIWKYFGQGFSDESPEPSDKNIVMFRLADIILLKAEAHHQLGETIEALQLLNIIRTRAGLPNLDIQGAIDLYGDVESAILHERLIELSFEGHRWFDLVRTGKAIEVMNPINGLNDEANLLWPIHEDALNRNPSLVQNSFYQ